MFIRCSLFVAALGVAALASPAPAAAQGKQPSCTQVCESRCLGSSLPRGECVHRCKPICEANRRKK